MKSFNQKMLLSLCKVLGSPWTVYIFGLVALVGLTQIKTLLELIMWFSQTFVQFVALAIIQGGQNIQSQASESRMEKTMKHISREIDRLLVDVEDKKCYNTKVKIEDLPKLKKRLEVYKSKLGLEGDLPPGSIIKATGAIIKQNNKINKNGRTK